MFNHATTIVNKLAKELEDAMPNQQGVPRARVQSEPCLPQRLTPTGILQRDAKKMIPRLVIKQLRYSLALTTDESIMDNEEISVSSPTDSGPPVPTTVQSVEPPKSVPKSKLWKGSEPQSWEVFRAIEQKNLMFLMEVREHAFHLLLRKSGDATPLVHCMRIGKSHGDVAIVLLGAFSRWINNLQDDEIALPKTKVLLRALRTNLKLAIDYGLQSSQSDLIASFMQTLIMSEGDKWVHDQVVSTAIALRAGTDGKPVQTAEDAVRNFATRELGKARHISALEDYVANATSDLLMMGAWHCALDSINEDPIPRYYFARDDRVYKVFGEMLDKHASAISLSVGKRLRWQFRVLRAVMEGRATSYHQKVDVLKEEFDEGPGV